MSFLKGFFELPFKVLHGIMLLFVWGLCVLLGLLFLKLVWLAWGLMV